MNKKPFIEDKELDRDIMNLNIPLEDQSIEPATDEEMIRAYGREDAIEMGLISDDKDKTSK
jgi:hypothetical protein